MRQNLFALYERQSIEPFNDMTLYVHKTRTDILIMTAIGNIFISNNNDEINRKIGMFERFFLRF